MKISMLIGGQDVSAQDGATFDRRDPVTGEIATTAPAAKAADAAAAAAAAGAAFPGWSATSPAERRRPLLAAADALEGMAPELSQSAMQETGATGPWIGFNCMLAAGMLREAASMTTQITGEVIPANKPGTLAITSSAKARSSVTSQTGEL